MGISSHLRRGGFSRADGPHRFISNDERYGLNSRDLTEGDIALALQHLFRESGFAFFQHLADTYDRLQPGSQRNLQFAIYRVVSLAKILPPLRVTDDHVGTAHGAQHGSGNLPSVCALFFPEHVLPANSNLCVTQGLHHRRQAYIRRAESDIIARVVFYKRKKCGDELTREIGSFAHLPVGGNQFSTHKKAISTWQLAINKPNLDY